MSTKAIERELTKMKARLNQLEARMDNLPKEGWRAAFGMMKDSKLAREAARLGAEYRTKENKRK